MKPYIFLSLLTILTATCTNKQDSSSDPGAVRQLAADPMNLPKTDWSTDDLFVDSLPIPRVLTGMAVHPVDIRAFKHLFHAHLDSTWVLGYVAADTKAGQETLPGPTIEAVYGQPTRVNWQNKLTETLLNNPRYTFPNKWYPIVYNLNDPLKIPAVERLLYPDFSRHPDGLTPDAMMDQSTYYATTVHLHGANLAWRNDGYPSAKLLVQTGTAKNNHQAGFQPILVGLFGPHEKMQQQSYTYPNTFPEGERTKIYDSLGIKKAARPQLAYTVNTQSEGHHGAILWYHDHAMMRTTTNVYSGLAGAYIIKGDGEAGLTMGYSQHGPVPDIPLIITDRSFTRSGRLYYNTRQNDSTGEHGQPEFFGNTITVNGKVWPYMNVDRGLYRFRVLNTSPSRFVRLALLRMHGGQPITEADTVDQGVFVQIGTEGGLMPGGFPTITRHDPLTLAPGERADVLINFSTFRQGDSLVLVNYAPNEPYGDDDDSLVLDSLTNQVMQFRVNGVSRVLPPNELANTLNEWSASPEGRNMTANLEYYERLRTKKLSKSAINTILKNTNDSSSLGRLLADLGLDSVGRFGFTIVEAGSKAELLTSKQLKPFRAFLSDHGMPVDSLSFPMAFMGNSEWNAEAYGHGAVKRVRNLRTEIWAIKNQSPDVHPIHTHLNRFRILARQRIDSITGKELPGLDNFSLPEKHERGWKDVVRVKPGFETFILVQYILNEAETSNGQFVYHCHILAHEDVSMMRRLVVLGRKNHADPALAAALTSIPLCGIASAPWHFSNGN